MSDSSPGLTHDRPTTIYGTLGLTGDPFPRNPLAGVYVPLPEREQARATVGDWLHSRDGEAAGISVVSGASGSGKTRLFDQIVIALGETDERLVGVIPENGARRSDAQLLRAAIGALGGTPVGRTGLELGAELRTILDAHRDDPLPPVMLVDNAALTGSQLEILRNILAPSVADAESTRVQVVLFGPPELPDRIARRRALTGFVRHSISLAPLDTTAMRQLLRTRIASVRTDRADMSPILDDEAIDVIGGTAAGNPGTALAIGHAALREAIATGSRTIDRHLAQSVAAAFADQALPAERTDPRGSTPREAVVQTRLSLPGVEERPESPPPARRRRRQQ